MIAFTILLPIIALGVATAIGLIVFLLWNARNVLAFLAVGGLMLFGMFVLLTFSLTRVRMEQQHAIAVQHEIMARDAVVKQAMAAQGFEVPVGQAIEFHNGTVTVSPTPPMPPMPPVPQVAADHQLQRAAVMPMVAADAAYGETAHPSPMVAPGHWVAQAPVATSQSPALPAVATASAVAESVTDADEQPAPAAPADEVKVEETPAQETPATPEETPTAEVPAADAPAGTPLFADAEQASDATTAAPTTEETTTEETTADETASTESTDQEAVASEPATPAAESAAATDATTAADATPAEVTTGQGVAEAAQTDATVSTTPAEVPAEVKQDELAPLQTEAPSAAAEAAAADVAGTPVESTPTSSAEAPAAAAPSTAATLSVPAWVENPPREIDGRRVDVLISEPFEIRSDCERDLDRKVAESVYRYACEIAAHSDKFLPVSAGIHPEIAQLARREQYTKVHASSVGDMQVVYQLVVFDENVQRRVEDWVRAEGVHESLKRTTGVSAMALGLLAGVFGIFRLAARRSPDPLNV